VTVENHERPQERRSPGRDLNPGRAAYEAEALPTRPRRSVGITLPDERLLASQEGLCDVELDRRNGGRTTRTSISNPDIRFR
jgi:hypothetical protein